MARLNFQVFKDGGVFDSMPVITPMLWENCVNGTADRTVKHDDKTFHFIEFRGHELIYGYHGAVLWDAHNNGEYLVRISLCNEQADYEKALQFHLSAESAEQATKAARSKGIFTAVDMEKITRTGREFMASMWIDEMLEPAKAALAAPYAPIPAEIMAPNTGLMAAAERLNANMTYGKFGGSARRGPGPADYANLRQVAEAFGIDFDEMLGKVSIEVRRGRISDPSSKWSR